MRTPNGHTITVLLNDLRQGDAEAASRLWSLVYGELHGLARKYLRREDTNPILQTTALVNEAYLRIFGQTRVEWRNRAHFYGVAAQAIRRVLVDLARSEKTAKRGGLLRRPVLHDFIPFGSAPAQHVLDLDEALRRLKAINNRWSRVVELRFFAGLTIRETARVLQSSPRTVAADWEFARAWLRREMRRMLEI